MIDTNKNLEEYIAIVDSIQREGFRKDEFIEYIRNSDFSIAPASTKYHGNYAGGLCKHCLGVYYNLRMLVANMGLTNVITDDNIKIAALMHDLSKINFYEEVYKNVKVGDKWEQVMQYKVRDDRFIYGNHEFTAEYIARNFIDLDVCESVAIIHHMNGKGWDSAQDDTTAIYNKYPLAILLHLADMLETFINE